MSTPSREILGAAVVAVLLAGVSMHAMAQVQSLSSALEAQDLTSPPPLPTDKTYVTHQDRVQAVKDYQQAVPTMAQRQSALSKLQMEEAREGDQLSRLAPVDKQYHKEEMVSLTADRVIDNDGAQTVSAVGHVEIVQGQRILRADRVDYDLNEDVITANGNVVINEPTGQVHFAEHSELTRDMSEGFVSGLESYLTSGGHFTAKTGDMGQNKIKMREATYTPCECETGANNGGWQIKSPKMVYKEDQHEIVAHDATFHIFGKPVLWTPYMSMPDGEVKQQSGFLTPDFGFHSNLGAVITERYYWALAPDKDVTLGSMITTEKAPVAEGEYRQRFDNGSVDVTGTATYSDYADFNDQGVEVDQHNDTLRGNFFANGAWDIDDLWRAGADVQLASDDQYLREYKIDDDDILQNQLYAERFDDRDYFNAKVMGFQDLRVPGERTDQPNVLPSISLNDEGDPNALLGGRWNLDTSLLGLQREGTGEDVERGVLDTSWQRRYTTNFGLINTLDTGIRGDYYYVEDRDPGDTTGDTTGLGTNGSEGRFSSHVQLVSSMPFAKPYEHMQAVIEPVAGIAAIPDNHLNSSKFPDEDSQDVELDPSNLFDYNRYPGDDRIEEGVHATYGVRTGLYGYKGSYTTFFMGQTTRFGADGNDFPQGSGLQNKMSDLVGQVSAGAASRYGVDYRFLLDNANFSPERHEVSIFANWSRLRFSSQFTYDKTLQGEQQELAEFLATGADIDDSREQIENNIAYSFNDNWRVRVGAINDLGPSAGLRRAVGGIDYFGCCVSMTLTVERNVTTVESGDNGTDVMFRLGLKGLGGFQTPQMTDRKTDGLWRSSDEVPAQ